MKNQKSTPTLTEVMQSMESACRKHVIGYAAAAPDEQAQLFQLAWPMFRAGFIAGGGSFVDGDDGAPKCFHPDAPIAYHSELP